MRSADGALIGPFKFVAREPGDLRILLVGLPGRRGTAHHAVRPRTASRDPRRERHRLACPLRALTRTRPPPGPQACHPSRPTPWRAAGCPISSRPASSAHGGSRASSRLSGTSSNHSTTKRRNCSAVCGIVEVARHAPPDRLLPVRLRTAEHVRRPRPRRNMSTTGKYTSPNSCPPGRGSWQGSGRHGHGPADWRPGARGQGLTSMRSNISGSGTPAPGRERTSPH